MKNCSFWLITLKTQIYKGMVDLKLNLDPPSQILQNFEHDRSLDYGDQYPDEVNSEHPRVAPKKLKIKHSKRKRQRPHSCKRSQAALKKIKTRAFMMGKNVNSSNRLKRYGNCSENRLRDSQGVYDGSSTDHSVNTGIFPLSV